MATARVAAALIVAIVAILAVLVSMFASLFPASGSIYWISQMLPKSLENQSEMTP